MQRLVLKPKPPYDIRSHFETYDAPEPQPHLYENGVWRRALRLEEGKLVPVTVMLNDTVDDPVLRVEIHREVSKVERRQVIGKLRWIFNTDYDPGPLYEFMGFDPILREVRDRHRGLRPTYESIVYEAVIKAILQQQISLRVAYHMTGLLVRRFGDCVRVGGKKYWEFPSPQRLAHATPEELRACKLSRRKGEYIAGFSQAVAAGQFDPESLKGCGYEEIVERLTRFRGLGRWSAEMTIVTALGVKGVNPAGDLGTRKAISHFFFGGHLASEAEIREFTARWGDYKGMIAYYLIADGLHHIPSSLRIKRKVSQ